MLLETFSDRDLYIKYYATDVSGKNIGTELVSTAIEKLGTNNVQTVSGEFGLTNKAVYEDLIRQGMIPSEAAWGTPLGKTMRELGAATVEILSDGLLPKFKFGLK